MLRVRKLVRLGFQDVGTGRSALVGDAGRERAQGASRLAVPAEFDFPDPLFARGLWGDGGCYASLSTGQEAERDGLGPLFPPGSSQLRGVAAALGSMHKGALDPRPLAGSSEPGVGPRGKDTTCPMG